MLAGGVLIKAVGSGIVFTNVPFLNCGERLIRAARSGPDISGRTPSSAGTSRKAHPAAASAAPPARIRRAVRFPAIAHSPLKGHCWKVTAGRSLLEGHCWKVSASCPTGQGSPEFLFYDISR
ncbi:hypothetical protein GCM10022224_081270 [Nonomuraea antimicrobica]|uniref:Uncharacterized protein n=1 Tax=Nonomuraea antimicrobica TaxID=561173 RepID=A0ABP7DE68_9ACTN